MIGGVGQSVDGSSEQN